MGIVWQSSVVTMPVRGAKGRFYDFCGLCGQDEAMLKKKGRSWTLGVHLQDEHGLALFPGCAICGVHEGIVARRRVSDITGHIQTKHGHGPGGDSRMGEVRDPEDHVIWFLVDIRDHPQSTFHPRAIDLAILPARGDPLKEDVKALMKAAKAWRERHGASTSGASTSGTSKRGRRKTPSPTPRPVVGLDLSAYHKQHRRDHEKTPPRKSPPRSRITLSPPRRRTVYLPDLNLTVNRSRSQSPDEKSDTAVRPTRSQRKKRGRPASSSSSSQSPVDVGDSEVADVVAEQSSVEEEDQVCARTRGRKGKAKPLAASPSPAKSKSPQQKTVKPTSRSPSKKSQSPSKKRTVSSVTVGVHTSPLRNVTPPMVERGNGTGGKPTDEPGTSAGLILPPPLPDQPWESSPLPAHQVALQAELSTLAAVTPAEMERFQRLLNHLCATRAGGARGLLRDLGLLPQPQAGSIVSRVDGVHIHLPEGVLDFHQLQTMFRRGQHEEEPPTERGTKGGPGKKSKK